MADKCGTSQRFATHYELKIKSRAHPEDRILEKESILMILPSTSMERKEGAHGCQKAGQNTETHIRRQRSPFTVKMTEKRSYVKSAVPCQTAGSSMGHPR